MKRVINELKNIMTKYDSYVDYIDNKKEFDQALYKNKQLSIKFHSIICTYKPEANENILNILCSKAIDENKSLEDTLYEYLN